MNHQNSDSSGPPIRTGLRQPRIWAGVFILGAMVAEGFHHSAWPLWAAAICFAVEHGKEYERRARR